MIHHCSPVVQVAALGSGSHWTLQTRRQTASATQAPWPTAIIRVDPRWLCPAQVKSRHQKRRQIQGRRVLRSILIHWACLKQLFVFCAQNPPLLSKTCQNLWENAANSLCFVIVWKAKSFSHWMDLKHSSVNGSNTNQNLPKFWWEHPNFLSEWKWPFFPCVRTNCF